MGFAPVLGGWTPEMYGQLVAAVNISAALEHYVPILLSLQDCNFVRDTFCYITSEYCPPLEHHLRIVVAGLGLISVGVMLSLLVWIIYAKRPEWEEVFVRLSLGNKGSNSDKDISKDDDVSSRTSGPKSEV